MCDRALTKSVDALVVALCFDYERRERALSEKSVTKRTDTEFRYYNFKIFDAVAQITGERYAVDYIKEIGGRVGYAKTKLDFQSEVSYKNLKKIIKENIAKKLHLIDEL